MDALLVGLLDRDDRVTGKVLEFRKDFPGHLADAVFHEPGILVRGEHYGTFIASLQELVDAAAHRVLENADDLLEVNVLVVVSFDAEKSLPPLVVGRHGDRGEEIVDFVLGDIEVLQDVHRAFLHDVLGAGAGRHAGHFRADTLPDDRAPERPAGDGPGVHLDDFMAGSMADRGLALDHELAAHEDFGTVRVFVAVEEFSRHHAAEFLDLVHLAVNRLLENLVDHLEIAGKVGALEASGEVDVDIEVRDKNNRAFLAPVDFDKLLDVLDPDPGEVDPDIGGCCLDIRQILGEGLVRGLLNMGVFNRNRSSHPDGSSRCASLVFSYHIYVLCC